MYFRKILSMVIQKRENPIQEKTIHFKIQDFVKRSSNKTMKTEMFHQCLLLTLSNAILLLGW